MKLFQHKNLSRALLTVTAILLVACLHPDEVRQESSYKGDIVNYINELKSLSSDAQVAKVDELRSSLDFTKVGIYKLRTTETAIIAELKSLGSLGKVNKTKAIFFLNQNQIIRSTIVSFQDKALTSNYDQVILSILNMDKTKSNYSGKVSFHGPFQQILRFDEFENGNLAVNGVARKRNTKKSSGRVEACTDWYMVTTVLWSDGSRSTTEEYLYTECLTDCGEDLARYGRIGCNPTGGGIGGVLAGTAPSFPSNPSDNDIYEYTDSQGKYTKYQFNSQSGYWEIVEVILPGLVVQSKPETYPFLQLPSPFDGETVSGPDDLTYTYNGASDAWVGKSIVGQVEDLLIQDPEKLLNIPCSELPKWQTVAQKQASQAIKDKINQLNAQNTSWFDNWAIQTLNGANGTIANMDYFAVSVSTLPNNPATGTRFFAGRFS